MNFKELRQEVEQAVDRFIKSGSHLLTVNSSERSMTHALAVHLATSSMFKDWNVDCEYSRNGDEVKRVESTANTTKQK